MSKGQPFIWYPLTVFIKIVSSLSQKNAVALGGVLGSLVAFFSTRKVREAAKRCEKILGVSHERALEIVRGSYKHFGSAAAEFARMPVVADNIDMLVKSSGHEYLFDAVKSGRGAILATAHFGNWEYAACWLSHQGLPINTLGTDQRDGRITELIKNLRRAGGSKALGKASDLKSVIRALQRGEIVAVPIDQDAKEAGVLSPFLGSPASMPSGPAKLAARLGCDVIAGTCARCSDGVTYKMTLHPPMKGRDGKPFGKDLQSSVDDLNDVLSKDILERPEQWMWMYPMWESVERGLFDDRRD